MNLKMVIELSVINKMMSILSSMLGFSNIKTKSSQTDTAMTHLFHRNIEVLFDKTRKMAVCN